jgi:two-component system, sensor histidine kinase
MSLLRRLILLVLLAIMPILAVEITNQISLHDERVVAIHNEAERLAAMIDDEHARLVEGLRQLLSTWTESSALRERDMAGCQEMAERLRESYPAYLGISATDETGVIRCATMPVSLGVAIGDRPHVHRARETGGFAIGEFILRRDILRPFENPKKQSDGGGRLNPSRFLFRLAFLSWPLAPVRRIALFLQDS